jgi:uncharacterized protein (TIGR00106 family)
VLVQLSMFPTDRRSDSVSTEVAKVIDIVDRSGLPYKLTAMATIIEGEWGEVMAVVDKARRMLRRSHKRVYISMTIDDRKGAKNRLTGKVESVERRLGRKVRS